ncbi:YciI family protein [Ramlibacter sp.]|uniref:YciI family protein n=1 Tax=Ramlibacter sp. TaxID=1917967 RepID=UPI003D0A10AD
MHYLLFYTVTKTDFTERRAKIKDEHLRWALDAYDRGELLQGGSLGNPPTEGSVLWFKGDSPKVAEDFARGDPYVRDGLVTEWVVKQWNTGLGPDAAAPPR